MNLRAKQKKSYNHNRHLQKQAYRYKALGATYKYSTIVYAYNVSEARDLGFAAARSVYGHHARILRDIVEKL